MLSLLIKYNHNIRTFVAKGAVCHAILKINFLGSDEWPFLTKIRPGHGCHNFIKEVLNSNFDFSMIYTGFVVKYYIKTF